MDRLRQGFEAIGKFLREVRGELRKVIWPDRKQTIVLTSVVVSSVAVVATIIWVFDLGLSWAIKVLLGRG